MSNADLLQRSLAAVWHPCTQMKQHANTDAGSLPLIPIARGEGAWLYDFDGKRYLDGISSWWVNLFGHCNPRINAALRAQLDELERRTVAGQVRREAALVAQAGRVALGLQHALERVVDLGTLAQRLGERLRADRGDHELLHVDVGVGVRPAVDDVHHRHRQQVGVRAAHVAEQRKAGGFGGSLGDGQGHAEDGVGAQALLVGGAVQVDHRLVDQALLGGVEAEDRRGDLVLHVGHGLGDALAQVAGLVVVPQLARLEGAGGGTRRDSGPAGGAVLEGDLDLDGRVAA